MRHLYIIRLKDRRMAGVDLESGDVVTINPKTNEEQVEFTLNYNDVKNIESGIQKAVQNYVNNII